MPTNFAMRFALVLASVTLLVASTARSFADEQFEVKPLTAELCEEYTLDPEFYKKYTMVQDIMIATSDKVRDLCHREVAYQFDKIMTTIDKQVADRIREQKVLCLLIAHDELTSELPQFATDKEGDELDFYNWRQRGFLTRHKGRPTVVFGEEDVLEFEGGMQKESILLHEFGHVVHGAGFDDQQQQWLTETYKKAVDDGLWNDGLAAQRFRRVTSEAPVPLRLALVQSFPDVSPTLIRKCLDGGDILVNGKPTNSEVEVNKDDEVLIVFGGPKQCYAGKNRSEYWAEGFQTWYDTNRTMDHDHNHIHTRAQLKEYDTGLAKMCSTILGEPEYRFVSPRERAGKDHLSDFDPSASPVIVDAPNLQEAANDFYDEMFEDFWDRLREKYAGS